MIGKEFKIFMAALTAFEYRYRKNPAAKYITDILRRDARTNYNSVVQMVKSNENLEARIPLEAADCAFKLLSSGKFHFYRGVLNEFSIGPHLRSLFVDIVHDLTEKKVMTPEHEKNALENLRDAINNVG